MPVYLIHFNRPYKHARHYIGYSTNQDTLYKRVKHHKSGNGARLVQVVNKAGIKWIVARVWLDKDRKFERYLKVKHKNTKLLCPVCNSNITLSEDCQRILQELNQNESEPGEQF